MQLNAMKNNFILQIMIEKRHMWVYNETSNNLKGSPDGKLNLKK